MTQAPDQISLIKKPDFPPIIYGTAWKEERTSSLVQKAVSLGFRAIDTANQKKHYREDFLGEALLILANQGVSRDSLFLQTKFTYVVGQDHRLPYNPNDFLSVQVKTSFESSLKNLHTDYLDSFLLHGPASFIGMTDPDWQVWKAMGELYKSGQAKKIGVSNVGIEHLRGLMDSAECKPAFVQNRCYAARGWDKEIRDFCTTHEIVYQGFSLLTGNPQVIAHPRIQELAERWGVTRQHIIFQFASQIGIIPITGTTDIQHMTEDLQLGQFELSPDDLDWIESIGLDY
jgi:diketogulonate reductase-like aldo/keto reductase